MTEDDYEDDEYSEEEEDEEDWDEDEEYDDEDDDDYDDEDDIDDYEDDEVTGSVNANLSGTEAVDDYSTDPDDILAGVRTKVENAKKRTRTMLGVSEDSDAPMVHAGRQQQGGQIQQVNPLAGMESMMTMLILGQEIAGGSGARRGGGGSDSFDQWMKQQQAQDQADRRAERKRREREAAEDRKEKRKHDRDMRKLEKEAKLKEDEHRRNLEMKAQERADAEAEHKREMELLRASSKGQGSYFDDEDMSDFQKRQKSIQEQREQLARMEKEAMQQQIDFLAQQQKARDKDVRAEAKKMTKDLEEKIKDLEDQLRDASRSGDTKGARDTLERLEDAIREQETLTKRLERIPGVSVNKPGPYDSLSKPKEPETMKEKGENLAKTILDTADELTKSELGQQAWAYLNKQKTDPQAARATKDRFYDLLSGRYGELTAMQKRRCELELTFSPGEGDALRQVTYSELRLDKNMSEEELEAFCQNQLVILTKLPDEDTAPKGPVGGPAYNQWKSEKEGKRTTRTPVYTLLDEWVDPTEISRVLEDTGVVYTRGDKVGMEGPDGKLQRFIFDGQAWVVWRKVSAPQRPTPPEPDPEPVRVEVPQNDEMPFTVTTAIPAEPYIQVETEEVDDITPLYTPDGRPISDEPAPEPPAPEPEPEPVSAPEPVDEPTAIRTQVQPQEEDYPGKFLVDAIDGAQPSASSLPLLEWGCQAVKQSDNYNEAVEQLVSLTGLKASTVKKKLTKGAKEGLDVKQVFANNLSLNEE